MKIRILTILFFYFILVLELILGSPIEITTQPEHRIGTLIGGLIILIIFILTYRNSSKIKNDVLKIIGICFTTLLTLPYLWLGLWTIPQAIYSDNYPMLEDISEYTNHNGERIVVQFMELSGSLHHYQNRKIIYDFNNGIRISYIYPDEKINGTWTVHRFEFNNGFYSKTDTIYTADFKHGRIE